MTRLDVSLSLLLAILVAVAAVWDLYRRRIPDLLVLAGAVAGLLFHFYLHGYSGLWVSFQGFGIGFILFLPVFLLRGMGGGDVKLMAAIGAIAGPQNCIVIFLFTAIFGGILAFVILLRRGRLLTALRNIVFILRELVHLRDPSERRPDLSLDNPSALSLPYAVPVALGSFLFLLL